jgi:alpha-beta hydrolase superfamily lysophospholipase
MTKDNIELQGILYNSIRKPSWDDTIFLYSHGNAGWLGCCLDCSCVKFLSQFGSVFIYDYRGYGTNKGSPSEFGLYNDIAGAWNLLTSELKISPNKIIIVGNSLGTSLSSKLVANLIKEKKKVPKALILNAPFSTIHDAASDIHPILSYLSIYGLNNIHNLNQINNKIPVCTLHSKHDTIINYDHSLTLKNETKCDMIEINGGHNDPVYNEKVVKYIKNL